MRITYLLLFLSVMAFSQQALAVMELNFNFGYDKTIYGTGRENTLVSRSYSGSWAWYLFGLTALELNYYQNEDIITEHNIDLQGGLIINSVQNRVMTQVYGVGLRQALAGKRSFIMPVLSIGYAKQFKTGKTTYNLDDNGSLRQVSIEDPKRRADSVFGTFMLKINMTRYFSLTGSVKTVFKAFEWNEAKNNLRYMAGLSWLF